MTLNAPPSKQRVHPLEIVRTDDGNWLAVCYECGWHGTYCRTYTAAAVDRNAHARSYAREAKR